MIQTGTNTETIYISVDKWKGRDVCISNPTGTLCAIGKHELEVMHHYGDKGEHYCPTMFLMCHICGGIADEPEPYECNRWGE